MNTPHKHRRSAVHIFILMPVVAIFIILWLSSCSPKHGCYATKNMRGYGWVKCYETGKVCILNPTGKIVCVYFEQPSKAPEW